MSAIKKIESDWRADKWNLTAKSTAEARTDAQSCMNDLNGALRAFPSPAPVRSAVDMLELYQRILFNTMDAHDQTLASKEAELVRLRADAERYQCIRRVTGAGRDIGGRVSFVLPVINTVKGANLMKGSVAQHFDDAIDAIRALTQPTE